MYVNNICKHKTTQEIHHSIIENLSEKLWNMWLYSDYEKAIDKFIDMAHIISPSNCLLSQKVLKKRLGK